MTSSKFLNINALKNPGKVISVYGDYTIHTNNNVLHNEEGPAVYSSIEKSWFINGIRHRDDGPAIMYLKHPAPSKDFPTGERICEWFVDGKHIASYQLDEKSFNKHWTKSLIKSDERK